PAKSDLADGRGHSCKADTEIPFLPLERDFDQALEQLLMTIEKGLMHGVRRVDLLQRRMVVTTGGDVAKQSHVRKAAEVAGDRNEPLGYVFFDDQFVLREALNGFQRTLPTAGLRRIVPYM